jgi:hypothetical protein
LSFSAVKKCGISKKDLKYADPFDVIFKRMMNWIYNRMTCARRKAKKNGKHIKFRPS